MFQKPRRDWTAGPPLTATMASPPPGGRTAQSRNRKQKGARAWRKANSPSSAVSLASRKERMKVGPGSRAKQGP
eukprot:10012374-Heterocapsa_arctica.AAC.1